MAVTEVTDTTFDDVVLRSTKPVLVDYWADWCSPCRQIAPIIDELSDTYGDQMVFTKLDTNQNPVIPTNNMVRSLPTIQIFVDGELVKAFQGSKTKSALVKAIEEYI